MDNLNLRLDLLNHTADLLMTLVNRSTRLRIASSVLNPIIHHPSGGDIMGLVNDEAIRRGEKKVTPVIEEFRVQTRRQIQGQLDDRIGLPVLETARQEVIMGVLTVTDIRSCVSDQAIVETIR